MNNNAMEKLQAAMQDKKYAEELMALENVDDIQAKLASAGVELTREEVEELVENVVSMLDKNSDELDEAALENVAGGAGPLVGMAVFLVLVGIGIYIGWKAAGGCKK